jgi:hypothetical protein
LAIRFESLVESDTAPRSLSVERQCEKNFRWDSFIDKFRDVIEPELFVVLRMPHETTTASLHALQP